MADCVDITIAFDALKFLTLASKHFADANYHIYTNLETISKINNHVKAFSEKLEAALKTPT